MKENLHLSIVIAILMVVAVTFACLWARRDAVQQSTSIKRRKLDDLRNDGT